MVGLGLGGATWCNVFLSLIVLLTVVRVSLLTIELLLISLPSIFQSRIEVLLVIASKCRNSIKLVT